MSCLLTFWNDKRGNTSPLAMVLLTAITAVGLTVGLVTLRDHLVQQFGDVAVSLDSLDQSFSYELSRDIDGDGFFDQPGEFIFSGDFVDSSTLVDDPGMAPALLDLSVAPADE